MILTGLAVIASCCNTKPEPFSVIPLPNEVSNENQPD